MFSLLGANILPCSCYSCIPGKLINMTSLFYLQVIDISLANPLSGEDLVVGSLSTPIKFNMTVNNQQAGTTAKCVYYDTTRKAWNQQGITTIQLPNNVVQCSTTHLTSFAVIQEPTVITTPSVSASASVSPTAAYSLGKVLIALYSNLCKLSVCLSRSSGRSCDPLIFIMLICLLYLSIHCLAIKSKPAYPTCLSIV